MLAGLAFATPSVMIVLVRPWVIEDRGCFDRCEWFDGDADYCPFKVYEYRWIGHLEYLERNVRLEEVLYLSIPAPT